MIVNLLYNSNDHYKLHVDIDFHYFSMHSLLEGVET